MRAAWRELGLRGRLALSIGLLVLIAFGIVFVFVRGEMADESHVISHEEARERGLPAPAPSGDEGEGPEISPISDAQDEVERTFLLVGGMALAAALLGGYLIAARTASPLRRMATTAEEVRSGNLTPRLVEEPAAAPELRALIGGFNRMLERLDLAFTRQRRFVSDASHELRTPLTAIRGQLEVLAADPGAEEVQRVKAVTLAEVERMERLVEELLALARLDEGAAIDVVEVDLTALLRETAAAGGGAVELGELAPAYVAGSPELLARVVANLLANARRHTGSPGEVRLSAARANGRVTVSVDDDGPGIPPAERERVFERFHRIDSARSRNAGGSGLGLAISREIIEAHGGRIWVEDSPLGGARVAFELPAFTPAS